MRRLSFLKLSLLAGLASCGRVAGDAEDGPATGTGTDESGPTTDEEGSGTGETTQTETGDTDTCPSDCENPVEIADGIIECADGRINRIGDGSFDPTIDAPGCAGTEELIGCMADTDCPGTFTQCISTWVVPDVLPVSACECADACDGDADCGLGKVCLPPGVLAGSPAWPTCIAADCASADDCAGCGECGLSPGPDSCDQRSASCRTPDDTCVADEQCFGGVCITQLEAWGCDSSYCGDGRPLLVNARPRVAPIRRRNDWAAVIEALDPDDALARHWAKAAAFEHASVASFARFSMQLLGLGAPPRLILACKRAALDEVEHARLTYGLASMYAGEPVGPGPLNLQGVTIQASWREVVRGLIVEACVGETLGVAEAMTAADRARSPALREVFERIAADELRHAQLAWQCLQWLLDKADAEDRAWALRLLAESIAGVGRLLPSGEWGDQGRPDDGLLGTGDRRQLHADARVAVLVPLARALAG